MEMLIDWSSGDKSNSHQCDTPDLADKKCTRRLERRTFDDSGLLKNPKSTNFRTLNTLTTRPLCSTREKTLVLVYRSVWIILIVLEWRSIRGHLIRNRLFFSARTMYVWRHFNFRSRWSIKYSICWPIYSYCSKICLPW